MKVFLESLGCSLHIYTLMMDPEFRGQNEFAPVTHTCCCPVKPQTSSKEGLHIKILETKYISIPRLHCMLNYL